MRRPKYIIRLVHYHNFNRVKQGHNSSALIMLAGRARQAIVFVYFTSRMDMPLILYLSQVGVGDVLVIFPLTSKITSFKGHTGISFICALMFYELKSIGTTLIWHPVWHTLFWTWLCFTVRIFYYSCDQSLELNS